MQEFGDVLLVEEWRIGLATVFDELVHVGATQAGDPAAGVDLAELVDLGGRQHSAVAHPHEVADAEART